MKNNKSVWNLSQKSNSHQLHGILDKFPLDEKWIKAERAIRALANLGEDWDGRGSDAVNDQLVSSALQLCLKLRKAGVEAPRDAYPLPDGSIILEFQNRDRGVVRYEVEGVGKGQKITAPLGHPIVFEAYTWEDSGSHELLDLAIACEPSNLVNHTDSDWSPTEGASTILGVSRKWSDFVSHAPHDAGEKFGFVDCGKNFTQSLTY